MELETPAPQTGSQGKRLGQLLVELGYMNPDELARALKVQQQSTGKKKPLGIICVEMGFLSQERLDHLLDRCGKRLSLSEILIGRGRVDPCDIERARRLQHEKGGRLGEILIEMGLIDEETLTATLAEQFDLPYVPLAEIPLHPDLTRYVNAFYAHRHGVVPVGLLGRCLTVAVHDPTQRGLALDLESSTGLRVRVVLSTKNEIEARTRRLYESSTGEPAEAAAQSSPEGKPSTGPAA